MCCYKNIKTQLHFASLLICVIFLFITGCSKNNPSSPEDNNTPIDPNAPVINSAWDSWIKQNSNEIKSLDSPDLTDLQFLSNLLQNKKIVQLGENCHGVKEFSKAKVRLIKYLHENMGFNIMAFESSVFDCFYAYNNKLNDGPLSLMGNSIFGVWWSEEVKELFSYIIQTQNTSHPLKLVGFDTQPSSPGWKQRPAFLKSVFGNINLQKAYELYQLDNNFEAMDMSNAGAFNSVKDSLIAEYQSYLDLLENNWDKAVASYPANSPIPYIAKLSIRSNIKYINQEYYRNISDDKRTTEERDAGMAYNLAYLYNYVYPNEKFIVWAHNAHICYSGAEVKDNTSSIGTNNMGHYLQDYISKEIMYTVGLYMYRGTAAYNDRTILTVAPETSNNIEAIIYRAGHYYTFVDMLHQSNNAGNSWMFQKMTTKYWGVQEQFLIPREQYDAILFIYETHPPDYISFSSFNKQTAAYKHLNFLSKI